MKPFRVCLFLFLFSFLSCSKEEILPNLDLYDLSIAQRYSTDPGAFNFIHFSDAHYHSNNSDLNMREMLLFAGTKEMKSNLSAIISTGDISNGSAGRNKTVTIDEIRGFMSRAISSPVPFLNITGNHDDNINYVGSVSVTNAFSSALSKAEQYQLIFKPLADKWPSIRIQPNRTYYYTDFAKDKIRIIALDAYDYPLADRGNGAIKYWYSGHYYSQHQLEWLYDVLSDTPDDYGLIVLTHAPFTKGFTEGTYVQGSQVIPSIIHAYQEGGLYKYVHKDTNFPELSTHKDFDFTAAKPREFICYLSGHVHSLHFLKPDQFPGQWSVIMPNMWTSIGERFIRNDGELRNSFGFISVNRKRRKISVVMYGAYRDRMNTVSSQVTVLDY